MTFSDVVQFVGVIGPGFLLLKVLYVFGGQHRRLQWEWVVWSVITGLLLSALANVLVDVFSFLHGPFERSTVVTVVSFGLAFAGGAVLAFAWYRMKGSNRELARRLVRYIGDSAWDFVLDEANRRDRGVEVTTVQNDKEVSYYGSIDTFGQEVAGAEPWLYLTFVYRWEDGTGYVPLAKETVGMLFHQSQIKRLRFIERGDPVLEDAEYTPPVSAHAAAAAVIVAAEPAIADAEADYAPE